MNLPSMKCYDPKSEHNGRAMMIQIGELTLWFSYSTLVAFRVPGSPAVVRQNQWGPTTDKHLNAIDGGNKAERVDGTTFERMWGLIQDPAWALHVSAE